HPALVRGMAGLEDFILEDGGAFRLQPAVSPVWDTALAVIALADSGLEPSHPALLDAGRWLLSKQISRGGDWQVKNPGSEPGGWPFEFFNDQYPDIDDTAVVAVALMRVGLDAKAKDEAIQRGLRWVVGMQSKNGGWASFDKDNDKQMLAHIPFADFMTPLDPTTPDVTAHVVEMLGRQGYDASYPALGKGLRYLEREQEAPGPWYGRWGVNYIYGTAAVLLALAEVKGGGLAAPARKQAAQWLKACQNGDGGWGESCLSYEDPSYWGKGPSTASQTAWALLGLLAAGEGSSAEAQRGVSYLVAIQRADGTWAEEDYTGTGFPRAFYLRYHLYRNYFPLMALSRYRAYLKQEREAGR
ncbi:MAG: squalene--hopene cyclase, partial [Chloroflexota bacterium]|nr:squalene--hopene cyclase [Chloroflexota bacterium]